MEFVPACKARTEPLAHACVYFSGKGSRRCCFERDRSVVHDTACMYLKAIKPNQIFKGGQTEPRTRFFIHCPDENCKGRQPIEFCTYMTFDWPSF